jgi:hypothetical protein
MSETLKLSYTQQDKKHTHTHRCKTNGRRRSVVVEALCYKPEGQRFETRRCKLFFFSIYLILPAALGPGDYEASHTNECQKQRNVSGK